MKKVIAGMIVVIVMIAVICAVFLIIGNSSEERRVLRVGMECAYAPYNWSQTGDSNGAVPIKDSLSYANGYDVMMAKKIAEALNCDLEIYQIEWDSLPLALQAGTIDCVIAGQLITEERLQTVDFSIPYYYAYIVTLVNSDGEYANATGVSDLEGAICTSQMNTNWYDDCLPQIPNADILPAMESVPNMLVALNSRTVDLVVTDMPPALAAVQVYSDMKILDFTENPEDNYQISEEDTNVGISVKKGNTELLNEINEVLANYDKTDFDNMMNEAISIQPLNNESE